jgi:hypothetical protein
MSRSNRVSKIFQYSFDLMMHIITNNFQLMIKVQPLISFLENC